MSLGKAHNIANETTTVSSPQNKNMIYDQVRLPTFDILMQVLPGKTSGEIEYDPIHNSEGFQTEIRQENLSFHLDI